MKKIITLLACCAFVFQLNAQAPAMAELFANMPDHYLPQLENAWRKDLIDLYESGKDATLKNALQGQSTLQELTPDYIKLAISNVSVLEMKLLPLVNHTAILCLVRTVYGPVPDSQISFYTTEWKPLDTTEILEAATEKDFLKPTTDPKDIALAHLDIDLFKYELNAKNTNLTQTYTTPLYLSKEELESIAPLLNDTLKVYKWKKYRFSSL
ncbi:MAG: DUF3256 family protein [Massilibacteroides sp.]|nr:DUF3256 family protein [Massilibacteroides sp.]